MVDCWPVPRQSQASTSRRAQKAAVACRQHTATPYSQPQARTAEARAAAAAGDRLRRLGTFDTVSITLDAAPPGIPGSVVVVLVDVAEARGRAAGDFGVFANTQVPIQLEMSHFAFT